MATRRVVYGGNSCSRGVVFIARTFGSWKKKRDVACYSLVRDPKEEVVDSFTSYTNY